MTAVRVCGDGQNRQEIDHLSDIHVVVEERLFCIARQAQAVVECPQVLVVLVFSGFLFCTAGGVARAGKGVVHLVQGALSVDAHAHEPVFVAVLHDMGRAPEFTILLDAHRKDPVVGTVGRLIGFIRQDVAHVRLVRKGCHQIDVICAGFALGPFEIVSRMKVHIIALLGEPPAGLTVNIDQEIVVKLAIVEEGTPRPRIIVCSRGVLYKPVQHRQGVGQAWILYDRAAVLGRILRIEERGISCLTSFGVRGCDIPAHHLSCRERGGGDEGRVVVPFEAAGVAQGYCDLLVKIDSVMKLRRCHGIVRLADLKGNEQTLIFRGYGRHVIHVTDGRPETLNAFMVGGTRRGCREVPQQRLFLGDLGQQFGQDQQVCAVDAIVEALNGQDVGAHVQKVKRLNRHLHWLGGCIFGSKAGRTRVPRFSGGRRRIVSGDLTSIEVRDHPVTKTHAQGQGLDGRGIVHLKRYAYVDRFIAVPHGGDIQTHEPGVAVSHACGPGRPGDVIETLDGPGSCSLARKPSGGLGLQRTIVRYEGHGPSALGQEHGFLRTTIDAIGDIRDLNRIHGSEFRRHGRTVRTNQGQILPFAAQLEIRVELEPRHASVLCRGKDDQVGVGVEQSGGESPFGEVVGLVGEIPSGQVHNLCAGIVDLDPVLFLAINIVEPLVVDCHELVDANEFLGRHFGRGAEEADKHSEKDDSGQ